MKTLVMLLLFTGPFAAAELPVVRVGSKNFTEGYVLAEILSQAIERSGEATVERRFGMGGTGILFESLNQNSIDIYPEYSGTVALTLLHLPPPVNTEKIRQALAPSHILVGPSLGFSNSYGLAVHRALAAKLNLKKISDLRDHPGLRMAFSYEFMERQDGYPAMARHYHFISPPPVPMSHALVYSALAEGKADVVEIYTTDSKIKKFDLVALEDDSAFFPKYEGLFLYREELARKFPGITKILAGLAGKISNEQMTHLNDLVENAGGNFADAAGEFFSPAPNSANREGYANVLGRQTKRHLLLVIIPVLIATLLGVPMGVLAAKVPWVGRLVLAFSGVVQVIPALALLCFLIPIFGIGLIPSMVALVLYSLLPIVRSTYSGILGIEAHYQDVAKVLGLSRMQKLFRIEFPLASLHIMGGIQMAAVIAVGMATLAAFIGAGGYGSLILTGLALNDNTIILEGALPAAVMALLIHAIFEWLERIFTPKGLRI